MLSKRRRVVVWNKRSNNVKQEQQNNDIEQEEQSNNIEQENSRAIMLSKRSNKSSNRIKTKHY